MATESQREATATLEEFYKSFIDDKANLNLEIDEIAGHSLDGDARKQSIDHCLAGIAHLSTQVKNVAGTLPAHDQRTYADAIKALSDRLRSSRESSAPRSKFSFKSKLQRTKLGTLDKSAKKPAVFKPEDKIQDLLGPNHKETGSENVVFQAQNTLLAGLRRAHRIVQLSLSPEISAGTIVDISESIVDATALHLSENPLSRLTVRDVDRSLMVFGLIAGPIHLTNIQNSVIVVACRQFRMHETSNCDVYLHCSSRPIIEGCSGVRFAPLPRAFTALESTTTGRNKWAEVDDFDWLRNEASPNWTMLPSPAHVTDDLWQHLPRAELGFSSSVSAMLKEFKI